MPYNGPERRIHAVISTRNREYHVRAGICIAVRDKKSGVWISSHEVIGMKLEEKDPLTHYVGKPLHFISDVARVQTTRIEGLFRPGKSVVDVYGLVWSVSPHMAPVSVEQLA